MPNELEQFQAYVEQNISEIAADSGFNALSKQWISGASKHKYVHNLSWLGRPIMQVPHDIYAMQEIVWTVRPDLIIETGIAHGGSLVMSASMLALLEYCDAAVDGAPLDTKAPARQVVGIDIDIRPHNRVKIESHPLSRFIHLIQASSTAPETVEHVRSLANRKQRVLVFLDSNHTHDHVLAELEAYAPIVSIGSYCVVFDTGIEDLEDGICFDRPWGKGNNPKTAVWEFMRRLELRSRGAGTTLQFEIDKQMEMKLAITGSPDGFLKRIA